MNDITNCILQPSVKYGSNAQTVWDMLLRCCTAYDDVTQKGIFFEGVPIRFDLVCFSILRLTTHLKWISWPDMLTHAPLAQPGMKGAMPHDGDKTYNQQKPSPSLNLNNRSTRYVKLSSTNSDSDKSGHINAVFSLDN